MGKSSSHRRVARVSLDHLTARIRAVEGRGQAMLALPRLSTGWQTVDRVLRSSPLPSGGYGEDGRKIALGGLARRAVHEWFGSDRSADRPWTPPVCILVHLAWQAILSEKEVSQVVWVGRCVWPHPKWLVRCDEQGRSLLQRSIFVDPTVHSGAGGRTRGLRLWAIDVALRNPLVSMVIADGSQLNMAATRRLLLAAEVNNGLGLLARPASELTERSAATTRWRVDYASSTESSARWTIELLRNRSAHRWGGPFRWTVQWDHETGAITVPADVVGGPCSTQKSGEVKQRLDNTQIA